MLGTSTAKTRALRGAYTNETDKIIAAWAAEFLSLAFSYRPLAVARFAQPPQLLLLVEELQAG